MEHSQIDRAIAATINPTMRSTRVASALPENLSARGETIIHRPTMKLSHSSHPANADSAAIDRMTIAQPPAQAFQLSAPGEK